MNYQNQKQKLNFKLKTLIIGIGPARCMTSWFADQLNLKSEVYIVPRKELCILHKSHFDFNHYYKIISNNNTRSISMDYSVDYTVNISNVRKNCEKLKSKFNFKIKYIFFYKDPIKRFISHYWNL